MHKFPFMRSKRKRRLLLFFAAVLLTALVVEAALRLAGYWLYRPIEAELTALGKAGKHEFIVLCVGDSHTYGVDAPRRLSYPRQLANLLNNADPKTRYRVINYGVPGANSSQALRRLREMYASDLPQPHLVIINVGKNNDHNFQEARFWLDERMKRQPLAAQMEYLLQHAKLYRLGELAVRNMRNKLAAPQQPSKTFLLEDMPLLTDWLHKDYQEMVKLIQAHQGKAVFLDYFMPFEYVDRAMTAVAETYDVPHIEIVWFRLPIRAIRPLVGPTAHPNDRGYAAIARFVFAELQQHQLLPNTMPAAGE